MRRAECNAGGGVEPLKEAVLNISAYLFVALDELPTLRERCLEEARARK